MKNDLISAACANLQSVAGKALESVSINEATFGRVKERLSTEFVPKIMNAKDAILKESASTIGRGKEMFQNEFVPTILKTKDRFLQETVPTISLQLKSFVDSTSQSIKMYIPKDLEKYGYSFWMEHLKKLRSLYNSAWEFVELKFRNGKIAELSKKMMEDIKSKMP